MHVEQCRLGIWMWRTVWEIPAGAKNTPLRGFEVTTIIEPPEEELPLLQPLLFPAWAGGVEYVVLLGDWYPL